MVNAYSIRPFLTEDEAEIIALWDVVFPGEASWNRPADIIARKKQVQPDLFLVASQNGVVIGTVMAGYDGVRGWVHHLAVHPDHRRKGLASDLMRHAESGLRSMGCAKLNLQVRSTNLGVIQFYKSLGFDVEDRASLGKPLL